LSDAAFDGNGLGCAEGGDDLGCACPIKGGKEGGVMAGDSSARVEFAEGPGLKAVKGLL
jgi:hypothetical protein